MLSEFEIIVNTSGVTIICPYLYTPRFIPFDLKGRCKSCKSDNVEIDYVIQPEGITIFCSRLKKEKFVPFDKFAKFNENDVEDNRRTVRIRSRSKSYNIPISRALESHTLESRALYLPTDEARALEEKRELASIDSDKKFATTLNISDIPLPPRDSSLVLLEEKCANVKNQSDIPLNISDVSSLYNVLNTRTPTSLITQTPTENISLPSRTDIPSLEPPLPFPILINASSPPLSRSALSSLSIDRTARSPSPIVSPISFFPDL